MCPPTQTQSMPDAIRDDTGYGISLVLSQERTSQPVRERLQMGTRMCGNVGAVDKERTSLHVLNVPETAFPICITRTKFPGADHFYRKNGSWGTIFPPKFLVWGTKIFRTKIPVTGSPHISCIRLVQVYIYGEDAIAVVTTLCNGMSTTSFPSLSIPVLQSCLERVT